jgi:hypothetical protein
LSVPALLLGLAACCCCRAQILPDVPTAASRSGQFTVCGVAPGTPRPDVDLTAAPDLVRLDAPLLAVSCERIKQALLAALQATDQWHDKVYIFLHPARSADEDIVVTTTRFADSWNYRIDSPDNVDPTRLVRAVTQVLLLETANRGNSGESAAIPLWLAEGFPQLLMDTSEIDLILQASPFTGGRTTANRPEIRDARPGDLFKKIRQQLHGRKPLTLDELGQPPARLDSEDGDVFCASARLFIHELLGLQNGGAGLAAMLPELPYDPDWRVAFLHGFPKQFPHLVDLEKWWALESVYFVRHTPDQTWTAAEVLKRLDEVLRCPLQVQVATNEPAFYTDASLQTVIQGWDLQQQGPLLRQKIEVLTALKLRADPTTAGLAEQYRSTLQNYLLKMEGDSGDLHQELTGHHPPPSMTASGVPSPHNPAVLAVVAELDSLDAHRQAMEYALKKAR